MKNHINSIISFNEFRYKPEEEDLLSKAKITHSHYKTIDRHSLSIDNLKASVEFHDKRKGAATFVHCGYWYGWTGIGISAIQLYAENGLRPTKLERERSNHVEREAEGEIENLRLRPSTPWNKLPYRGAVRESGMLEMHRISAEGSSRSGTKGLQIPKSSAFRVTEIIPW